MSCVVEDWVGATLIGWLVAFGASGLVVAQESEVGNDTAAGGVVTEDRNDEGREAEAGDDPRPWRTAIYRIPRIGEDAERVMLAPSSFSGSPDVSRDGKKIAVDGWQNHIGQGTSDSMVYVVDLAKPQKIECLGAGAMPTWSPNGKWLAISHYAPVHGVSLTAPDGSYQELIELGGWSAEWSPTENLIAYTTHANGHPNLVVYNPETKAKRYLFTDSNIVSIKWGFTWSPDGQRICALVRDQNSEELVVVHVQGEQQERRIISKHVSRDKLVGIDTPVAWGGDGSHVIFYSEDRDTGLRRLYLLDAKGDAPAKLLPGQPKDVHCIQPYWHSDGTIYFVVEFPEAVDGAQ